MTQIVSSTQITQTLRLLALCGALTLPGCILGGDDEAGSSSRTYTLEYNGCSTGTQTFSSKEEYCSGLKDYKRNNNGCAYSLREDTYKRNGCPGEFEEINR